MINIKLHQFPFHWWATYGAIFFVLLFLTGWPGYHFQILDGPIPLLYYLTSFAMVLPLLWLRPDTLRHFLSEPSLLWFVIYLMSSLLWLLFFQEYSEEANRQFRIRGLSFIIFSTILIITIEANHKKASFAMMICVLVAVVTYWFDFLFPFIFVPEGLPGSNPGRAAGFFINANNAAYALVIMCIAIIPFASASFRVIILTLMLLGVVPTLSRSGIIFSLIVVLMWIYFKQLAFRQLSVFSITAPVLIIIGISLFEFGLGAENTNLDNITERLHFFSSFGDEGYDYSYEERKYVTELAWKIFFENPVLGAGIGATSNLVAFQSTHNMYLLFLAEQGLLGFTMYLALIFIILIRGFRLLKNGFNRKDKDIGFALFIFGIYYVFIGFFSHNLLDDPPNLFLMAFLFTAERNIKMSTHYGSKA